MSPQCYTLFLGSLTFKIVYIIPTKYSTWWRTRVTCIDKSPSPERCTGAILTSEDQHIIESPRSMKHWVVRSYCRTSHTNNGLYVYTAKRERGIANEVGYSVNVQAPWHFLDCARLLVRSFTGLEMEEPGSASSTLLPMLALCRPRHGMTVRVPAATSEARFLMPFSTKSWKPVTVHWSRLRCSRYTWMIWLGLLRFHS